MSINLHEVALYAQKLHSISKENDSIIGIDINEKNVRVQMRDVDFLSRFTQYEVTFRKRLDLYWFTEKIADVEFFTVITEGEIEELKSTIPDQWKYIDSKLSEEDYIFEGDSEEK